MPALAQERPHGRSAAEGSTTDGTVVGESTFLDTPPLPALDITEALRFQLRSFAAPEAPLGSGHVDLYRPELRARLTLPAGERAILRASGQLAMSRYRFRGRVWGRSPPFDFAEKDLDLYRTQVALQGAYRFDELPRSLVAEEEVWSLVGALFGGSRWEDGEFREGVGAGAAVGVGYEIPDRLHLTLGLSLRISESEGDLGLGPLVSLRWDVTDRLTVRTRELGLQLDYALTPVLDIHVSGFRTSERFHLSDRSGAPGDLRFRDRLVRVGAGFDWMLANWLHLELEIGGIAQRRIRIEEEDLGTLVSSRGDPSVYFDVSVELRL